VYDNLKRKLQACYLFAKVKQSHLILDNFLIVLRCRHYLKPKSLRISMLTHLFTHHYKKHTILSTFFLLKDLISQLTLSKDVSQSSAQQVSGSSVRVPDKEGCEQARIIGQDQVKND